MAQRRPFDPRRIRPPASTPASPAQGAATLSPRQVNEMIGGVLSQHLPPTLHVLGEIGNLSRPASGHTYFTLKDTHSELRCVMWRSSSQRLKFTPEVGMEVIATGGIEVYSPRGTYQLIVRKLEPRGVGALEVAFRQMRERLEREGLFDPSRKRPLPRIPQRVAVITSPTGAAIRDILHTLERRFRALEVLVFPVRVQGEGAAEEIAAAIHTLNRHADVLGGVDVAIVGRGGGSLEDLWAFNEELVARAIAASRIPIVSAVGHEIDVSIADLVADLRAPTPTAAAELITPTMTELDEWLQSVRRRAARTIQHALELAQARLATTLAYDGLARPRARLNQRSQLLDEALQRLRAATAERLRTQRQQLNTAELGLLRFGAGARFGRTARELEQRLRRLAGALNALGRRFERRLTDRQSRLAALNPGARLDLSSEHLHQTMERMRTGLRTALVHRRRLLASQVLALNGCAPQRVLQRGYSITRDARTRRILRSVSAIRDKMRIVTQLADGEFQATADDPRQPNLFDP